MKKETYDVTGMSCAACSSRVEKAVSGQNGVRQVSVNLLKNSMVVEYDESALSSAQIVAAVEQAGYGASPHEKPGAAAPAAQSGKQGGLSAAQEAYRGMKRRLALSLVFTVPLFYLSMGHMMGWPLPACFLGMENAMTFAFTQFLLLIPIVFLNRQYYIGGCKALIQRAPNMDSLIALGSGAAILYGIYAIYRIGIGFGQMDMDTVHAYMMELYFESAGTILTLITMGKTMEARAKGKTSDAITKLMDLAPKTATVERDGTERVIPAAEVQPGEVLIVKAGESVPVDGVVLEGTSAVNEAALTGESIPADKAPGAAVSAATVNQSGFLKCRATRVGEDTTLAQIIRMVRDAAATKAPIAKIADKVSGVFVPAVMGAAFVTFLVWLLLGRSVGYALARGISVLVISCPCALGLATPVAIMVGSGVGAKNGVLFKTAASLEETGRIQIVALDKTGTVTSGEPTVTDICPVPGVTEAELLGAACALEQKSEHPLAKAVLRRAQADGLTAAEVTAFQALPGSGLQAALDGQTLCGGNADFIRTAAALPDVVSVRAEQLAEEGKTPLFFARGGKLLGVIAVADVLKPDSPQAIRALQNMGIRVVMLTGDNARTAKAIGAQAGVDEVIAGVLPDGKEREIRRLSARGKVAMVGDGINDAPALTRADVGIAIGAGTDVAIDAADVVLVNSRLSDVPAAIRLSRATLRNIHENLFWAFFYNTIGIPIAAGVFVPLGLTLSPMLGAAAMSLSSFCVVTNALRLNLFDLHDARRDHKRASHLKEVPEIKEETAMKKTISIEGMMCTHCEATVKKALEALPEVTEAAVSHTAGTAVVTLSAPVDDAALKAAVEAKDYTVTGIA